jgi:ParB family chromosome partitioning protein
VSVSELKPNCFQPRRSFDQAGLERLAESIRTTGMMQPIVVRAVGESWEIVAGERRWRAAQRAGLEAVPVIVCDVDDRAAAEWALIENLQREDLNPIDRAVAFRGLVDRFGLTHAQIAQRVGLERSTVANLVRLMDLEPEIQEFVRTGVLNTGHAKALLSMAPGAARIKLAAAARAGDWSVRHLEEQVRLAQENSTAGARSGPDTAKSARAAGREELQRQLGEHLGTKVQIKTNAAGDKGSLVISFFGVDHFDSLMERFGFELRS